MCKFILQRTTTIIQDVHRLDVKLKSNIFGCDPNWRTRINGKFKSEACET